MAFPDTKIQTIHHAGQRYDTVGDYWSPFPNRLNIRVSAMGDEEYEFLVAIHEFVEAMLCRFRGISDESIDSWDKTYSGEATEPGADALAPYHKEHMFAESIERLVAAELRINWEAYDAAVKELIDKGEVPLFERAAQQE